jgi:hypothetical protein
MMDSSMQMGTGRTGGRSGALMVSFGHSIQSANVRVEYELARCDADIILLEFILGREEPLKVISRKSRGGLIISNCSWQEGGGTYGGGTLFFFSFLRLNNIQSKATRTIPPTTPPTIPPIAPPLNPDDLAVEEASAEAIVAAVVLEAEAELELAIALDDAASEEADEAGADDAAEEDAAADEATDEEATAEEAADEAARL